MLGHILAYTSAACLFMAVGGCAVFQGSTSNSTYGNDVPVSRDVEEESTGTSSSTQKNQPRTNSPAISALIGQAEAFIADGEFQNAGASLERGLRIEPKNPELYSRLAGVKLLQGQPDEAESLAKRSNTLAKDWPGLQSKNWTIISRAMRARGEDASADAAEMRASQLKKIAGE